MFPSILHHLLDAYPSNFIIHIKGINKPHINFLVLSYRLNLQSLVENSTNLKLFVHINKTV